MQRLAGKNFVDCGQRKINLFFFIVEVRRHPDAGSWPPVDQNIALQQLRAHFLRMGHVHGDRAAAARRVARRAHASATLVRQRDDPCGEALRFFANLGQINFAENLQSRHSGVQRWNVQRAV